MTKEALKYELKLYSRTKMLIIFIPGMIFSFALPVILRIHVTDSVYIFFGLMISGFISTIIYTFRLSVNYDIVAMEDHKIISKYYGTIDWSHIESYYLDDTSEFETLKIRMNNGKSVSFTSRINKSYYRKNFEKFTSIFLDKLDDYNSQTNNKIIEKSFYNSKIAKPFGIVMIILIVGMIGIALFQGNLNIKNFSKVLILIGIAIPVFYKIFYKKRRNE